MGAGELGHGTRGAVAIAYASDLGTPAQIVAFYAVLALVAVLWLLLPWRRDTGWRRPVALVFLLGPLALGPLGGTGRT